METPKRFDTTDPRVIFVLYGVVLGVVGVAWIGWGPVWIGSALADSLRANTAVVRLLGGMLVAVACFSAAVASVDDPGSRFRARLWFVGAHAAVLAALFLAGEGIWGPGPGSAAAALVGTVLIAVFLFTTDEALAEGERRPLITLFGGSVPPSTQQLRSRYAQHIREAASQEERNRLARDLHDSIKQQVFAIQTAAATAQVRFEADPAGSKAALEQVRTSAREAMTEMEAMLDQLRAAPLEQVGLVEALKKQCDALRFRTGVEVTFAVGDLRPNDALAPGAPQAILRIAQEALANVGRHARAKNVRVALGRVGVNFDLAIEDDGVGFDPALRPAGMGLANMRERAQQQGGTLQVQRREGGGTTVTLSIPSAVSRSDPRRQKWAAIAWGAAVVLNLLGAAFFRNPAMLLFSLIFAARFVHHALAYVRSTKAGRAE